MKHYLKTELNAFDQDVGIMLVQQNPIHFQAFHLQGASLKLQCLNTQKISVQQLSQLWEIVNSEPDHRCWTYLPYSGFETIEILTDAVDGLFGFSDSVHYLIEVNQQVVGWIAMLNIREQSHVLEIGNVYFSHVIKQSTASTEAVYLLLKASFEQGFRRVEWKCDALNLPSKRAALRYGFQFEGVFRQDRISKGRNRNTAWYSILDEEWVCLEQGYQGWLSADNFDEQGIQKNCLNHFIELSKC